MKKIPNKEEFLSKLSTKTFRRRNKQFMGIIAVHFFNWNERYKEACQDFWEQFYSWQYTAFTGRGSDDSFL